MKAKPFVKWAGGKKFILPTLEQNLPVGFGQLKNITYIEPFVGGGAMLFHMLNNYTNIKRVIINDINLDLINCYRMIKDEPQTLIDYLKEYEVLYYSGTIEERNIVYYSLREKYNEDDISSNERAALFIFLNKTCFNGLYRVNNSGKYNVPTGRYKHPLICDKETIMLDHQLLNSVEFHILNGDYKQVYKRLSNNHSNFVYLDPPYRPLSTTSYFKEYSNSPFGDTQQEELKQFCDKLTNKGCQFILSNSDSKNEDGSSYFEELYQGYNFSRIYAPRFINALPEKRVKLAEVLIKNYQ